MRLRTGFGRSTQHRLKQKMRTIVVPACLGLLLWVDPVSAQELPPVVHTLKIIAHPTILPRLTIKKVKNILVGSSRLLTIRNRCNVKFELDGPITSFPAGTPKDILTEDQLEAVHRVTACGSQPSCSDVKLVATIKFCKTPRNRGVVGCAWRRPENGPKTMIVTHTQTTQGIREIVWAHEFGHTAGLQHRDDDPGALMTHCDMHGGTVKVEDVECNCFRAGPGNTLQECLQPDPNLVCPSHRRHRNLTD